MATYPFQIHNTTGTQSLLFVHGFPDTAAVFDDMVARCVAKGYRCITCTMPYYSKETTEGHSYFGYTMDGIADILHGIIVASRQNDEDIPVIVAHDFGVIYATWLCHKYTNIARAIFMIDVGSVDAGVSTAVTSKTLETLHFYGRKYQYRCILMWILSRLPVVGRLQEIYLHYRPLAITDAGVVHNVIPASAYSYFYVHTYPWFEWIAGFTGYAFLSPYPTWFHTPPHPLPTCFVYGTRKPFMFHDDMWAKAISLRTDGSSVRALETGHWCML